MQKLFKIRMKELREKAGYNSQKALADYLGIAQSTVGNWESGTREPNTEMLIKLSTLFGCTVDYLLGAETAKTATPKDDGLDDECKELVRRFCEADENGRKFIWAAVRAASDN